MDKCNNEYRIFEFVEGELSQNEFAELESHLKECKECNDVYKSYAALKKNVTNFYGDIDLNRKKLMPRVPVKNKSKKLFLSAAVIAIGIILFVAHENKTTMLSYTDHSSEKQESLMSKNLPESKWNLEVNLLKNKLESITKELNQKSKY